MLLGGFSKDAYSWFDRRRGDETQPFLPTRLFQRGYDVWLGNNRGTRFAQYHTTLDPKEAGHYQSLIGILRWIVELGRCDINCEVSMMSSHLALPREGHLDRLYHIFAFLKSHHNAEVVYDPSEPIIDESLFTRKDWSASEMSGMQGEELPPNAPRPRGIGFIMRAYVDADHASETVTRKSRTGFVVFLNNSPIHTVSKKQTGVETSSFGSEFTAMKHCTEYLRGLRYKLRMMGIPVEGHAYVFGDNKSVLYNVSIPESILKKKSQSPRSL